MVIINVAESNQSAVLQRLQPKIYLIALSHKLLGHLINKNTYMRTLWLDPKASQENICHILLYGMTKHK